MMMMKTKEESITKSSTPERKDKVSVCTKVTSRHYSSITELSSPAKSKKKKIDMTVKYRQSESVDLKGEK